MNSSNQQLNILSVIIHSKTNTMKTKKDYRSLNGVRILDGMEVSFDMIDSLEQISFGVTVPYIGTISGEPFTNYKRQDVVSIMYGDSDGEELYVTVPVDKITIDIDMECEDCREEFNHGELKNVMIPDEVGKGLSELLGCPKCGSQNYIRNDM